MDELYTELSRVVLRKAIAPALSICSKFLNINIHSSSAKNLALKIFSKAGNIVNKIFLPDPQNHQLLLFVN